jgi:hypothetical protein
MRIPRQTGSDLMGKIRHLVQLSADLMLAGKAARRAGASARQLRDWCRDCLRDHPNAVEQLITQGMPVEMMIRLSNDLGSLGGVPEPAACPTAMASLLWNSSSPAVVRSSPPPHALRAAPRADGKRRCNGAVPMSSIHRRASCFVRCSQASCCRYLSRHRLPLAAVGRATAVGIRSTPFRADTPSRPA